MKHEGSEHAIYLADSPMSSDEVAEVVGNSGEKNKSNILQACDFIQSGIATNITLEVECDGDASIQNNVSLESLGYPGFSDVEADVQNGKILKVYRKGH